MPPCSDVYFPTRRSSDLFKKERVHFLNMGASAPVFWNMHFKHVLNCVKIRNKILCVHLTEICVRHKVLWKKNLLFWRRKKDKFLCWKKNLFQTFFCLFHLDQNNDHLLTKLFAPPYNVDVYARDFFQIILACGNMVFGTGADAPEFRCIFPGWIVWIIPLRDMVMSSITRWDFVLFEPSYLLCCVPYNLKIQKYVDEMSL